MVEAQAAVALVPPMGGDERCWDGIDFASIGIPETALQRYVYPGHGSRPRQPGMTFGTMADEMADQLDGTVDMIAIAAGVTIAAHFIARHPERVRSLMLICAGFSPALGSAERAATEERAARPLTEGMSSVIDEMQVRWFSPAARAADNPGARYSRECLEAMDPEAWSDVWHAVLGRESTPPERIEAITAPVSMVAALGDPTGGVKNLQTAHRYAQNSRLEYVPGPHMIHLERPAEVLGAVERHFLWLESGAGRVETPLFLAAD